VKRARLHVPLEPAELEEAAEQRPAERPGDVAALFRPVAARTCSLARPSVDAQAAKARGARAGHGVRGVSHRNEPLALERVRDGDAEPPGQVVVAVTRIAQRVRTGSLP
jgi:hypothetical protein